MLPSKVQPGLVYLAVEQLLWQRSTAIGRCGLGEPNEFLLLAFVQGGRDADGALAGLLAPDQSGRFTVLSDAFFAHHLGDGQNIVRHVMRARVNQAAGGGDMSRPVCEHRLAGKFVGQEWQRHLVGAAKLLLVRQFRGGGPHSSSVAGVSQPNSLACLRQSSKSAMSSFCPLAFWPGTSCV